MKIKMMGLIVLFAAINCWAQTGITLNPVGSYPGLNPLQGTTLATPTAQPFNQDAYGNIVVALSAGTPTPSFTPTPTYTNTTTFTVTLTQTKTPTLTNTPVYTATGSATPVYTATPTFTGTISVWQTTVAAYTATPTYTSTGSATPTYTATPSYTFTPTKTLTPTFTWTPTFTPTVDPTFPPTNTPTPWGFQIKSFDVLSSGGVTFTFPHSVWAYAGTTTFSNKNSAPSTFFIYPQTGITQVVAGATTSAVINSLGYNFSSTTNTIANTFGYCTGIIYLPAVTPTQTMVVTVSILPISAPQSFKWEHRDNYYVLWKRNPFIQGPENWKPVKVFSDPRNWRGV